MILDKELLMSDKQAVTVTAVSTNTIDLGVARDLGPAKLELVIDINTAFAGGTSMAFAYITSDNADLSSPVVVAQTPAIVLASLVSGSEWLRMEIPANSPGSMKRYIGVSYTVVGTMSAGAVTAGVVLDRQVDTIYASGLNTGGF